MTSDTELIISELRYELPENEAEIIIGVFEALAQLNNPAIETLCANYSNFIIDPDQFSSVIQQAIEDIILFFSLAGLSELQIDYFRTALLNNELSFLNHPSLEDDGLTDLPN